VSQRKKMFQTLRSEIINVLAAPNRAQIAELLSKKPKPSWNTVTAASKPPLTPSLNLWTNHLGNCKTRDEIQTAIENSKTFEYKSHLTTLMQIAFASNSYSQGIPLWCSVDYLETCTEIITPPMHTLMGIAQNLLQFFQAAIGSKEFGGNSTVAQEAVDLKDLEEDMKQFKFSNRSPWKREARLRHILSFNLLPFSGLQQRLEHLSVLFNWIQTEIYAVPDPATGVNPSAEGGALMMKICSVLLWGMLGFCWTKLFPDDDKEPETDILKMNCQELKSFLKKKNLSTTGVKRVLLLRALQSELKHKTVGDATAFVNTAVQSSAADLGCECGEPLKSGEMVKCKGCCFYFHFACVNVSKDDDQKPFYCELCTFLAKAPPIFRRLKWHKFCAHLPKLREENGTLFPFLSMEEQCESKFGQIQRSHSSRTNSSDQSRLNIVFEEEINTIWKQRYGKSDYKTLHSLPYIKKLPFSNLVVHPCVWRNLWAPLKDTLKTLMSEVRENRDYGNMVGYCESNDALYFEWSEDQSFHHLCFCGKTHDPGTPTKNHVPSFY
jgi:hypothetical protein